MTRSRLVLLDANIVIELFRLGVWDQIVARCEVVLPETVIAESEFYDTDDGRHYIDWDAERAKAGVRVESLPPADVHAYCSRFGPGYYEKLDPGEAEALALMETIEDSLICSADRIVWRVLGNTNQVERGISLEELLQQSGFTKRLHRRFSKTFREQCCSDGSVERFMGRGDQSDLT